MEVLKKTTGEVSIKKAPFVNIGQDEKRGKK